MSLSVPNRFAIEALAIPAVSILISFLSYTSQFLFHHIDPGPLSRKETAWFNAFVLAIWWSYYKACTVDPGPRGWVGNAATKERENGSGGEVSQKIVRWCKKCDKVKPARAHHCKKCGRCIPKMDHHCPWTANCVSHTTFPHFIRFVFYAVLSMSILAYHLLARCYIIWEGRNLPAYLGPPVWAMAHLLVLLLVNGITLFALGILLVRAFYSLATNTTMIEDWEIERHEALVERARKTGGFVYANGGQRMRIEKQEFPYDIGIWSNICQGMGTGNLLLWFIPFSGIPPVADAIDWEVNGFEDEGKTWPPPDPEKMPRTKRDIADEPGEVEYKSAREEVEAFKRRQQEDWKRREEKRAAEEGDETADEYDSEVEAGFDGEPGWTNSDGDRLKDFGVDEDAEAEAEVEAEAEADDEIPLGELLRRRRAREFEQ